MCILLKLNYSKFGVSNLFFSKSYGRKTFGGSAPPHTPSSLGTGRVNKITNLKRNSLQNFTRLGKGLASLPQFT